MRLPSTVSLDKPKPVSLDKPKTRPVVHITVMSTPTPQTFRNIGPASLGPFVAQLIRSGGGMAILEFTADTLPA